MFDDSDFFKDLPIKPIANPAIDYWSIPDVFASSYCETLIEYFDSLPKNKGEVIVKDSETAVDLKTRDVSKILLPLDKGPAATMAGVGFLINSRAWKFDITHSDQSEYLFYDTDGHYTSHTDSVNIPTNKTCRKITLLSFLNDDFEGGKFYIKLKKERVYPPQQKGSVLAFPSYILHGVEPVAKGNRKTIVSWLVGPWFK